MPLQITPRGTVSPSDAERAALAREFDDRHCVRLPQLLHPALLRRLQTRLAGADAWKPNVHDLVNGPSTELVFADPITVGLLTAMFHDRVLWNAVARITDCDPIRSFDGRIYRMDAGAHEDVWHTDASGTYMVALSLNLTSGRFEGGELHLRECESKRMHTEIANTGQGDAIMFRIDGSLEHVVTPVTGAVPKIAWAGWFRRDSRLPELDRLAGL
jgi:2OG-Fe(II) oxygenase superfamily